MHRLDRTCGGASPATRGERGTCLSQLASAPGLRLLWFAWSDEPTALGPAILVSIRGQRIGGGLLRAVLVLESVAVAVGLLAKLPGNRNRRSRLGLHRRAT